MNPSPLLGIPDLLKSARKRKGLSIEELSCRAADANGSPGYCWIQRAESRTTADARQPRLDYLFRVARVLEIETELAAIFFRAFQRWGAAVDEERS